METLIGFVIGYLVGTQQGRDGLQKVRASAQAITESPEVREMLTTGASLASSAVKQVLSGGAGAVLNGAVESFTRRATEVMSGTESRRAA
jgi:hypothetical protein